MAHILPSVEVTVTTTLVLTEAELGALDALVGYGADPFLKVFYEHMGKHYMAPYEHGLRALFANVKARSGTILSAAEKAREAFSENVKG